MSCGGGHLGFPTGIKNKKFVEDLPMIIPEQFGFNPHDIPHLRLAHKPTIYHT